MLAAGAFCQQTQLVVAHGRPGSGKSTALRQLLLQVVADAGGGEALTYKVQQVGPCRVVYTCRREEQLKLGYS